MDTQQALALFGLPASLTREDLDAAYRKQLDQLRQRLAHSEAPDVREYLQQLKTAHNILHTSLAQMQAQAEPTATETPTQPASHPTIAPVPSPQPTESVLLVLPVSFHTFLVRDSRFGGKGEIRVDARQGSLAIQGRKPLRLWRSQEVFALANVRNARIEGKTVYFTLILPKRGHWRAVLTCDSTEAAAQLWNLLPEHSDPALFNAQDAQREMADKLKAFSPGTPVTFGLIALNVLVYLVLGNQGLGWENIKPEGLIQWGGNFSPLTTDGQIWRLLSAMFMHGGFTHLALNMVALYLFGRTIERIHGPGPYLALYLMAGLCGGIATLLTKPAVVSVGASGAIFGLMGLLVAFFLADRSFLSDQSRKSLLINAAVFAGYYLMQGFGKAGVDNAAHVGGFLGGLVTGYVVGTPARLCEPGQKRPSRLGAALLLATAVSVAGYWLAPDIRPDYRQHLALVQIAEQIAQNDKATQAELQGLVARAKSNNISDDEAAAILDKLAEGYGGLESRLRGLNPKADGLKKRQQVFLRYVVLRKEAFDTLRQAAIANDSQGSERFMAKMQESTDALKELSSLKHWYP